MAIRSKYNFVGGYENDTQAGVLHVANHHISPGKKQWTWEMEISDKPGIVI